MSKILGLDLGTNSIGWAIRDTDENGSQFITVSGEQNLLAVNSGVVIFKKGVGEGKSGEFSLAAERRKNRGKRRLYNAKRYRKWATLKVLSENGMCPLSDEELRLWSVGNWHEVNGKSKNNGRVYPTSPDFIAWLAMDFKKIGKEWNGEKLKPAYTNTYELRVDLLENHNETDPFRLLKIGRAFYHLVQRRGFKTSRKNGKSAYGENEYLESKIKENPEWKAAQILQYGLIKDKRRIRNSGVIQRRYFENEFSAICEKQKLSEAPRQKIHKTIYFVRPLRTQKGLVGKCTLEKGKTRIPISHPAFEEFRALSYINNIQWRETGSRKVFQPIPIDLKKEIFKQLFFRKLERGKNKGKVDNRSYFEFKEIVDKFSENYKYEFNYAKYKNDNFELYANPNVSTCPVIAGLMNVFENEWESKFITDSNSFGVNWQELTLSYNVKYQNESFPRRLNYIDIWHLIFDFIQTKDNEDDLKTFCKDVLKWNAEKIDEFTNIDISQGYGSLSYCAIHKIIPFLQEGFIYSDAATFANLSNVLDKKVFALKKKEVEKNISDTITKIDKEKKLLNITNSLIQQFFSDSPTYRAKGVDDHIKKMAADETNKRLLSFFGENNWNDKTVEEKGSYQSFILEKYLRFLNGKQEKEEKASARQNKNPEIDYYRLPRLDNAIKEILKTKYGATDNGLKKLYHPSEIDVYPKSITGKLEDPNPPSKGWKNPMAMRTMYELRKLVNYLLETDQIDVDTKIVVEMARELNDANKRWAIQTYQKSREDENKEFAKAIIGVAKEKYPNLNENDADNVDKVRLWWEQLENGEEIYKEIKNLKEDVQKYRLWKEQECQCLYTGKMIGIVDLFDGTKTQFEHTLYLSKSFDNSLANLTIADADYNMRIKKNQIPTQLKNYSEVWNGFSEIEPRLEKWKDKVKSLKDRIERNKIETKKAIRSGDIERKNYLIKARHLLQFDLDYWDKKLKTFTLTELPNWWKNSQLVDTQIISKYAKSYLKTVFNKVDVQKGLITAEFRKIYGIMGDEKKDRTKHSHHAVDAAVLTLIPGSAQRENILEQYYDALEHNIKFHISPYSSFNISHIQTIENNVLINHVSKDQTLSETKKNVRTRGVIKFLNNKETKEFIKDEKGNKIPLKMQGDCIRGQLHDDTYFGAIKVVERNENGFAKRDNGNYVLKNNNGEDEIWLVKRFEIEKANLQDVIDVPLRNYIQEQLFNGTKINDVIDFNNNKIRHIRCRIKSLTPHKAIYFKNHVFKSKHSHKEQYIARNTPGGNYLNILYEGTNFKNEVVRSYRIISLFEFSELGLKNTELLKFDQGYNRITKGKGKQAIEIRIKRILKVGDRVIMWDKSKEELKILSNQERNKRLYSIYKFNNQGSDYNYLQHHLEARPDSELGDGDIFFDPEKYQPRLKLGADKFNCLIENEDFSIKSNGMCEWLF